VRLVLCLVVLVAGCHLGGEYVSNNRAAADVDRGEVNGRSFEFITNKPEGDDWQIRIRDNSMSVGYGNQDKAEELGVIRLTKRETRKVWDLIDALDIEAHKKGRKDEDEGYVMMRIREPGEEELSHDMFTIYVSRATNDDDVIALAEYLRDLVAKYRKEKPNF